MGTNIWETQIQVNSNQANINNLAQYQIRNLTAQVKVLMDEVEDLKRELKQIKTAPVVRSDS